MKKILSVLFLFLLLLLSPQPVSAHAFGTTYTLPIPFWLYSYAAAGVLLVSFLIIGFFFTERKTPKNFPVYTLSRYRVIRVLTSREAQLVYKAISLFLFFLTIITGFIGEDISLYNFNMTFFWVIFVLGFTYLTFFLGNIWEVVNPWKSITDGISTVSKTFAEETIAYPRRFAYYPAFFLYLLFISIELFFGTSPFSLSVILVQYTLITLFAVYLFGSKTWFRYGEFFSVFFRFISYTSILTKEKGKIILRLPFTGLLTEKATDFSMLLFILFMLSSTAFDGFRETNTWAQFYWSGMNGPIAAIFGGLSYQIGSFIFLILSPFLFLVLYISIIWLTKQLLHSKQSVRDLAFAFAFSLVPIALVYNLAHYFTLFLLQGQEIIRLISDPFGWNWNLFGTAGFSANPGIIGAAAVWHTQVALILLGHVVAVLIAHIQAIRLFPTQKHALLSQLPMLLLMVIYTVIGLWILSQPLSVG